MQSARLLFFVGLALNITISSVCHADAGLPPVLNSYPKCDYQVVKQAEATDKTVARDDDIALAKQTLLHNTIVKIRQQAAEAGAEAVILTDVQGLISNSESVKTIRHAGREVKYRVAAELITLCPQDNNLPTVYAPYNSAGVKQAATRQPSVTTSMQFAVSIPATTRPDETELAPLANIISLQHGFYGAKVGMTQSQVQTLFGAPDAVLALENKHSAWIYDREHQVVFAGNAAVAFSQSNNILSAEVKKRLAENLRFQQHQWLLDNTFSRRASLDEIKAFYQDRLSASEQDRFVVNNGDSQLILQFAPYLDVKNNSKQLQLVEVSLTAPAFSTAKLQLKLPQADALQPLKKQLASLASATADSLVTIPENILFNRSTLEDGGELAVVGPALALSFDNGQLAGLTITNIVNDYAVREIQQQLAFLELPTTRDAFLARFPDAFDSLSQLTLYGDHSEIKATYNNDELIDSLHIRWY
jgi:hypothetical protein